MESASPTSPTSTTKRALEIGSEYDGVCLRWIDRGHGYGFLCVPGGGDALFVSALDLTNSMSLERGDQVHFELRLDAHGRLKAAYCSLLDGCLLR